MAVVSELIRFILPRSQASAGAFSELRRQAGVMGLARTQYFGYILPHEGFPQPKPENQMCWYIEWPEKSSYRASEEFKSELVRVAGGATKSLRFQFIETGPDELRKGLESNFCQFAIIKLAPHAPRLTDSLETSMHKTFTDCYFAKGFTGGGWGYALNSNEVDGSAIQTDESEDSVLQERDRMLGYYTIGWDSLEDHHAYAKTDLYAVEIDRLMPYFAPGSGAFYVEFQKHT